MNGIKYLVVIILSFCIDVGLNAKTKVTDGNSRNKPEWIQVSQADYLVAIGKGITLDKAKSNAENSLESLVITVAVNQMKTKNTYLKGIDLENEVARKLFKKSAYYSDFDAKNHNIFYWEKLKNKETKSKTYHYYLQYYLNIEEMERAINEVAFDHEVSTTFESIKKQLPVTCKVQDFDKMNMKLMFLNSQFLDDDIRKVECEELLAKVEENYKNIEIKEMLNIPGKIIVCQTLNDRAIYGSKPPKVRSKSALINSIENFGEQWVINFKYVSSQRKTSNVISVEFDNARNKKARDFEINSFEENVEVKLTGAPIVIKRKRMIKFYVASSYRGDVVLERIVLRYNNISFTDTRLNQLLDGAGMYTIRCQPPPGFYKTEFGDKVSGELHYKSKITGKQEIYRFYSQKLEEIL